MWTIQKHEIYSQNKKFALSLAVLAGAVLLIFLGVWIEGKITDGAEQEARLYQTALKVTNDEQLNYSIDTKQGRVFAPITVKSVDLVKFPEMNKSYSWVQKTEETYTKHEREVCSYDEEGNVEECHTEYYYTWDTTDTWTESANEVEMAGRKYPFGLFSLRSRGVNASDIIDGQNGKYVRVEAKTWLDLNWGDDEGDIRYSYDILELPQSGTVFLNVSERVQPAFGHKIGIYTQSAEELVKSAQNKAQTQSTVFTVFWVILIVAWLGGLGYAIWVYEDGYL